MVDSVLPGSNAEMAGLRKGDELVEMDNQLVSFIGLEMLLSPSMAGKSELQMGMKRGMELVTLTANMIPQDIWVCAKITAYEFLEDETTGIYFFESFPAGVNEGTDILVSYVRSLKLLLVLRE